jgi:hypothetical protein
MNILFGFITIVLAVFSLVAAILGPKKWIKYSIPSSFLLGIVLAFNMTGENWLYTGVCYGMFFALFIPLSGYWVKRYSRLER